MQNEPHWASDGSLHAQKPAHCFLLSWGAGLLLAPISPKFQISAEGVHPHSILWAGPTPQGAVCSTDLGVQTVLKGARSLALLILVPKAIPGKHCLLPEP